MFNKLKSQPKNKIIDKTVIVKIINNYNVIDLIVIVTQIQCYKIQQIYNLLIYQIFHFYIMTNELIKFLVLLYILIATKFIMQQKK